ncbi:hypothetical protein [Emticicia sp. TH156]|uniref:hypothetical protein n=1 Tax=Emticicia sp. TH156 TaxID=2067454 RepID=UPI000C7642B2|nr:hypothetical protein [Emticicia sp. TH156]PLK45098.1 hypothetical protein C0V77_07635 [Emticicia sp. TH156]
MKNSIKIADIPKTNVFKVPEGYFNALPGVIWHRVSIEEEEEPAVSFAKGHQMTVPANYFDTLSSRIMGRITHLETQAIQLENLPKVNIFKVPDGYFENAAGTIPADARLQSIEKKNIFEVPANYFDALPARIMRQTAKETKTIQVNWWQKSRTVWTAAASLVLMVGLGFAVPQFSESESEAAFNKLSKEDINNYLASQDLSYLEYEVASSTEKALPKEIETGIIDNLGVNKADIREHLESQDIEDI